MAKFNILNKGEKIVSYVLVITNKSPKKLRCDLIPMLRNTSMNVLNNIIRANIYRVDDKEQFSKRQECQFEILVNLRSLEAQAEICNSMNYLTNNQLRVLSKMTQELYDIVMTWKESDLSRCTTI